MPKLRKYEKELYFLSYNELVKKLLDKYGPAKYDYFCNENCKSINNNVRRSKEGLFCHHIDEDKAIMLSNSNYAIRNPFDYQKANRLVYCNYIEHLLLHIKIAEEPRNENANEHELPGLGGVMNFLVKEINDYFAGYPSIHNPKYFELIKDDFDDYLEILKYFWSVIQKNPLYLLIYRKEDLAKSFYLEQSYFKNKEKSLEDFKKFIEIKKKQHEFQKETILRDFLASKKKDFLIKKILEKLN